MFSSDGESNAAGHLHQQHVTATFVPQCVQDSQNISRLVAENQSATSNIQMLKISLTKAVSPLTNKSVKFLTTLLSIHLTALG